MTSSVPDLASPAQRERLEAAQDHRDLVVRGPRRARERRVAREEGGERDLGLGAGERGADASFSATSRGLMRDSIDEGPVEALPATRPTAVRLGDDEEGRDLLAR